MVSSWVGLSLAPLFFVVPSITKDRWESAGKFFAASDCILQYSWQCMDAVTHVSCRTADVGFHVSGVNCLGWRLLLLLLLP